MIVGILSDSHGRIEVVRLALAKLRARGAELVLHCGDIDNAETVPEFAGWNVHFVFGNCDWDRAGIRSAITAIGGSLHEPFGHIELDGLQIAWVHGDHADLMRDLELSEAYDFLFYGHTHVAEQHRSGRTRMVNPGALHRAKPKSCATLDTQSGELKAIVIG